MNNLQKLRKLHRLTQKDVTQKIDFPKPLYNAFEHERYVPPIDVVERIAKIYNVSTEYILNDMSHEIKERYN